MEEKDIMTLSDFREIRIPFRYRGDQGYEWTGGFVVDLDVVSDKWVVHQYQRYSE